MDSAEASLPFQWKGFEGRVANSLSTSLPQVLPELLENKTPQSNQVKNNLYRTVTRAQIPAIGDPVYFKRYRFPDWAHRMKYVFQPTRAQVEWDVATGLRKLGIATLEPLAYGIEKSWGLAKDAFFLSREIAGSQRLDDFLDSLTTAQRPVLFEKLGIYLARLHDAEVHHRDLHQGNLLARNAQNPELFLIDLHTARIGGAVSQSKRLVNLSQLTHSISNKLRPGELETLLNHYQKNGNPTFAPTPEFLGVIQGNVDRLAQKHSRSRDKRCLVRSSQFDINKSDHALIYRRRDFSLDWVEKALKAHESSASSLKDEGRSRVTRIDAVDSSLPELCVKEIRPGNLFASAGEMLRGSRGRQAWFSSHVLDRRSVPHAKAFALVEKSHLGILGQSYLIAEFLPNTKNLNQFISADYAKLSRLEKRMFLSGLAQFVAKIHQLQLYHRDFQVRNVLVRKRDGFEFFLIDLESLNPKSPLDERRRLRNLMQLNDAPPTITRTDKLRFLRDYDARRGSATTREALLEIIRLTQARLDRARVQIARKSQNG